MLLTATANSAVRKDLVDMLRLGMSPFEGGAEWGQESVASSSFLLRSTPIKGLKIFLGDFDRPNLKFEVRKKPSDFDSSMSIIQACLPSFGSGSAIVYCFSQKECMQVSEALSARGVLASPYHAGLAESYRESCQDAWTEGRIQVICATIAFGLGINMPNVRVVFHYTISKSLELYYQEVLRLSRNVSVGVVITLLYTSVGWKSRERWAPR